MSKTAGRWVVYELKNGQFVYLSKFFKSKKEAENERTKLAKSQIRRRGPKRYGPAPGIGLVKTQSE